MKKGSYLDHTHAQVCHKLSTKNRLRLFVSEKLYVKINNHAASEKLFVRLARKFLYWYLITD